MNNALTQLIITLLVVAWITPALAQDKPSEISATNTYLANRRASKFVFVAHQSVGDTEGRFRSYQVTFKHDPTNIKNSSVYVQLAANSVYTGSSGRDKHLKKEDFFHVKKHPHITFRSTSITSAGSNRLMVEGNLKIKTTITKVKFPVSLKWSKDKRAVTIRGKLTVDRFKAGITYKGPFYTPTIKKKVDINMTIVLVQQ